MPRKDKNVTPSVTQKLQDLGYNVADWDDSQTKSKLTDEIIDVLKKSSKEQNNKSGYPDRIYCNKNKQLLILVEEKPDVKSHDIQDIKKGCIEGIKWYLSCFNNSNFSSWKIIGIAVSGDINDEYNHKFTCFCILDNKIEKIDKVNTFLTEEDFLSLFNNLNEEQAIKDITRVSKKINSLLRAIDSQKRPIILSALMISLYKSNKVPNNFPELYSKYTSSQILDNVYPTVKNILKNEGIPQEKLIALKAELETLKIDQALNSTNILKQILDELNKTVIPLFTSHFSTTSNYDIMGKFYEEFLKFAGVSNVKKGIVLTPRHITTLFTKLIPIKANDVILDLCCGTGAFLIAGMNKLLSIKGTNSEKIKTEQLLGFEINTTMYICAISNMLFRGDGKSRIYNYDSINNPKVDEILGEVKPTIGFINPPYSGKESKEDPTPKEITFLTKLLDNCSRFGVIIAPLSMYFKDNAIRNKILTKHTLKYVINMPKDLFQPNASTSTAIAVFETHSPHDFKNSQVVFYDLKDDGFILSKNKGRTDIYNRWNVIEKNMLDELFHGNKSDNITISRGTIKKDDEWNIYAHSEVDYSHLNYNFFCKTLNDYLIFQIKKENNLLDSNISEFDLMNLLSTQLYNRTQNNSNTIKDLFNNRKWEYFDITKVFDKGIESTKGNTTYDLVSGDEIPYISAKKKNNGFEYFVSKEGIEPLISEGNGIVFIQLGDGSGGYSTYQSDAFIGMSGKTSVGYASSLNKYNALFIVTILDMQRYKYSFGRSWTGKRFNNTKIYLPSMNNKPDWQFMEDYIKSLPYGDCL